MKWYKRLWQAPRFLLCVFLEAIIIGVATGFSSACRYMAEWWDSE